MSILEMSLSGGCLILAGLLIRAVGKNRLPVGAFEALWAAALPLQRLCAGPAAGAPHRRARTCPRCHRAAGTGGSTDS